MNNKKHSRFGLIVNKPVGLQLHDDILKFCVGNNKTIHESDSCACFYCQEVFLSSAVTTHNSDNSALCPKCGMDTLIPGALIEDIADHAKTSDLLRNLKNREFAARGCKVKVEKPFVFEADVADLKIEV